MTDSRQPGEEVWTPLKVIQWAVPFLKEKGVESPRLDVECLLAKLLHCDRLKVYLQFDRPLSVEERALLRDWVARRAKREPLAYLLGEREFYGLPFTVNSSVLIPRSESEMLVEKARTLLEALPPEQQIALDLGTGSGCLAVALAHAVPSARVWAVDLSEEALATARANARLNGVEERIVFRRGSWWEALQGEDPVRFPVVLSNPPYISEAEKSELAPEITLYEPSNALFAENNGLSCYLSIKNGLSDHLTQGGRALFELNSNISDKITGLWTGWGQEVEMDLQGLPRMLSLFIPTVT